MNNKLVVGTVFTIFLIVMMPMGASVDGSIFEENFVEETSCSICAENSNNFFDILRSFGMTEGQISEVEDRIKEIKVLDDPEEPVFFLIAYLILWIIKNMAVIGKCIICGLMFLPLIPSAIFDFFWCGGISYPYVPNMDFPPICDSLGNLFEIYFDLCRL